MINSILEQSTIPILEQVAAFGQRRHTVLAGNIANIDTPDYKTRDLPVQDFEKALQLAVQARRENMQTQPSSLVSINPAVQTGSLSELYWQQPALPAPTMTSAQLDTVTHRQSLAQYFQSNLKIAAESEPRNLTFHDGGNRSIERESMEMTKNASLQSFAIEVMRNQFNILETVISERVV